MTANNNFLEQQTTFKQLNSPKNNPKGKSEIHGVSQITNKFLVHYRKTPTLRETTNTSNYLDRTPAKNVGIQGSGDDPVERKRWSLPEEYFAQLIVQWSQGENDRSSREAGP